MHLNQLKAEAKQVLPENHPFLEKLLEWEPDTEGQHDTLVEYIEDWERGIRDWSEVKRVIEIYKNN